MTEMVAEAPFAIGKGSGGWYSVAFNVARMVTNNTRK